MNNVEKLTHCRGCGAETAKEAWKSPPLPIHLWPLPVGAPSIDEEASVFICQNCGLAQLNDMSMEFVEQLYDKGLCVLEEQGNQHVRKSLVTEWGGSDFYKDKTILELGGGNNPFLSMVPEAGERWIADLKPEDSVHEAVDKVITGNFETIELPENRFDIICGYLVYEHFINPLAVTRQIAPALTEDGIVIIEVPNLHWLRSELPHYMVFHQHQSIFTLETLNYMMAVAKFECRAVFSENHVIYAAYSRNENVTPVRDQNVIETAERKIAETGEILQTVQSYVKEKTGLLSADKLSLYGAGGSMSLFLAYSPELRKALATAFDRDERKHGCIVPGTNAKVCAPSEIETSGTDKALILTNELRDKVIGNRIPENVTVTDILSDVEQSKV